MNEAKFQAKLREYAKLIVKIGANVQKGQRVRLQAGVDQVLLTQMVTQQLLHVVRRGTEVLAGIEVNRIECRQRFLVLG